MAHVISFTPRSSNPSGLLRAARERSGLNHAEFAALLGCAIGRPELSPGTIRVWERNAVPPPIEVLQAAQRLAQDEPPAAEPDMDRALAPAWTLMPAVRQARPRPEALRS